MKQQAVGLKSSRRAQNHSGNIGSSSPKIMSQHQSVGVITSPRAMSHKGSKEINSVGRNNVRTLPDIIKRGPINKQARNSKRIVGMSLQANVPPLNPPARIPRGPRSKKGSLDSV